MSKNKIKNKILLVGVCLLLMFTTFLFSGCSLFNLGTIKMGKLQYKYAFQTFANEIDNQLKNSSTYKESVNGSGAIADSPIKLNDCDKVAINSENFQNISPLLSLVMIISLLNVEILNNTRFEIENKKVNFTMQDDSLSTFPYYSMYLKNTNNKYEYNYFNYKKENDLKNCVLMKVVVDFDSKLGKLNNFEVFELVRSDMENVNLYYSYVMDSGAYQKLKDVNTYDTMFNDLLTNFNNLETSTNQFDFTYELKQVQKKLNVLNNSKDEFKGALNSVASLVENQINNPSNFVLPQTSNNSTTDSVIKDADCNTVNINSQDFRTLTALLSPIMITSLLDVEILKNEDVMVEDIKTKYTIQNESPEALPYYSCLFKKNNNKYEVYFYNGESGTSVNNCVLMKIVIDYDSANNKLNGFEVFEVIKSAELNKNMFFSHIVGSGVYKVMKDVNTYDALFGSYLTQYNSISENPTNFDFTQELTAVQNNLAK